MKKVAMKDLQNLLPLGFFDSNGVKHREFTTKPWKMAEEKAISKIKEDGKANTAAAFVAELLSLMIVNLGSIVFQDTSKEQMHLMLHRMFMADVLYMYVWLRRQALGKDVAVSTACPFCKSKQEIVVDLDEFETIVVDAEKPEDYQSTVVLKDGVQYGDKVLKEFILYPLTWQALAGLTAKSASNDAALKMGFFTNAIIGAKGVDLPHFVFTDTLADTLTKFDMEIVNKAIDSISGGINMNLTSKCDICDKEYMQGLNWMYDSFFTHLSIPSNGQR